MNVISPDALSRPRERLADGLAEASARHRARARRRSLSTLADAAVAALAVGGVMALVATIIASVVHAPRVAGSGVGLIVMIGILVPQLWRAIRGRPTLPERAAVAERLDVKLGDRNAIASALDLANDDRPTPLALRAIADGLAALRRATDADRLVPLPAFNVSRVAGRSIVGFVSFAAIALVPTRATLVARAEPNDDRSTVNRQSDSNIGLSATTDPTRPAAVPPSATIRTDSPSAASPSAPIADPTAGRADSGAGAGSGQSGSKGAGSAKSQGADASSAAASPQASPGERPMSDAGASPSATAAVPQTPSESAASPAGATPAADATPTDQTAGSAAEPAGPTPVKTDSAAGGARETRASASESGDGKQPARRKAAVRGGDSSETSSDVGAGGNGRSSGLNPPKKSRGVAPSLLGGLQPDLLQGRQSPGPEARSPTQVPPVPMPIEPDADVAAAGASFDEQATSVYRVPADLRSTVDAYFHAFHRDDKR